MESSPLGSLPGELRNEIYRLALCEKEPIEVECQAATYPGVPRRYRFLPGLLVTCKQARAEASEVYLADNTFKLQINPSAATQLLRLGQDDARHFWAFLAHLRCAGLPPPSNIVVYIRRIYSDVKARADRSMYAREVADQLYEITQLAVRDAPGSRVVCRLQASWGCAVAEKDLEILPDITTSAVREMEVLQRDTGSTHFRCMAAFFLWTDLEYIASHYVARCEWLDMRVAKIQALVT